MCWGCGHQWGQPSRDWQRALLLGDREGGPIRLSACGLTHLGRPHLPRPSGPAFHLALGAQSPLPRVPGGAGGAELSINLISASCSPHPQAAVSHPENGPGLRLGQQSPGRQQEEPKFCHGSHAFLGSQSGPSPRQGMAREAARGSEAAWAGGWALLCSPGGPHTGPGAQPLFLRKTELPKQINQPVKKKLWRKNLQLSQPRSSKGELFSEMEEETTATFFPSPLPVGAPPSMCSWEHLCPESPTPTP